MGQTLLAGIEIFALIMAAQGLNYIAYLDDGVFANIHNCIWFIFAILTNIFGLVAIVLEWWEGRSANGGLGFRTLQALQYHYFFSWMDLLVGYAALVTQTWLTYHPIRISHLHLALIALPIVAWLKRKSSLIVVTTQMVTLLAIISHASVTITAGNWWGLGGSALMGLTLIAMSLPIRYTFFTSQFSTREAAVLLSGLASFVFPCAIGLAAKHHRGLRKVFL